MRDNMAEALTTIILDKPLRDGLWLKIAEGKHNGNASVMC